MVPRFQQILVPVDFTLKNQAALDIASEIATANVARITLLHVIETIEGVRDKEVEEFYAQLEARAKSDLELMAQRFTAAGVKVDHAIRYGKRAQEIVRDSLDRRIDLIIMSSHKYGPAQPIQSFGTISHQVAVLCPCPVLLVK